LEAQRLLPIVERCVRLVAAQAHDQGIDIQMRQADSEAQASVDAKQLNQVLTNLLLNSMAAISGEGRIDMYVVQKEESVSIEVHDTGPGIPPDRLEHLFEAFYTTRSEGTGLGLAVSRELVRGMGGTITYRDGAPGAVFALKFPKEL
jgi:signal transduction histidine kinase